MCMCMHVNITMIYDICIYANLPVCRSVRLSIALYKYVCMYACICVNGCVYVSMCNVHMYASRYAYYLSYISLYIYGIVYKMMCICLIYALICSTSPSLRTMCQRARVNLNSTCISCIYGILLHCQGKKTRSQPISSNSARSSCQILSSKPSRFNLSKSGIGKGALQPPGQKMAATMYNNGNSNGIQTAQRQWKHMETVLWDKKTYDRSNWCDGQVGHPK